MENGNLEFTYKISQLERLQELLTHNSNSISSALLLMLSEKTIEPSVPAIMYVWLPYAEMIKSGRDMVAEAKAADPVLRNALSREVLILKEG